MTPVDAQSAIDDTRRWLERAVIGLNLCPFAKAVHAKGQVHYAVTAATGWNELSAELEREADELLKCASAERDTTLLIAPQALPDFFEFHAFTEQAERMLAGRGFEGVLQLASFHPAFQFAGTEPDDITNATNRAPHPTLHLLREASIDKAVAAFPDASAIYEANIETLRRLGPEGWQALSRTLRDQGST
ncbi:MAG TPA: DUF1415 domain-containing protein [Ramlibacter sp.]|nr:DUF1415 domain-containing protein [Ramlibacter sp.]